MRLERHEPLAIGVWDEPATELEELAHAVLWLRARLPGVDETRDRHLHLVRPTSTDDEVEWTEVEVAGHPMRRVTTAKPWSEERWASIEEDLRRHLASVRAVHYREAVSGLVSELGESRESFRARLRTVLRPAVGRRLRSGEGTPSADAGGDLTGRTAVAASELASILDGVIPVEQGTLLEIAVTCKLGSLLVPRGVELGRRRRRDPMIGDGAPIPWEARRRR